MLNLLFFGTGISVLSQVFSTQLSKSNETLHRAGASPIPYQPLLYQAYLGFSQGFSFGVPQNAPNGKKPIGSISYDVVHYMRCVSLSFPFGSAQNYYMFLYNRSVHTQLCFCCYINARGAWKLIVERDKGCVLFVINCYSFFLLNIRDTVERSLYTFPNEHKHIFIIEK